MGQDDEYRGHADECRRMAENTRNEHDKNRWLKMAQDWMNMVRSKSSARQVSSDGSDRFDAEQAEKGTGQKDSDSSH